ncbi:hypothetical protein GC197_13165 [bacterium]|nr:hypothetical protein [bacterium]
MVFEHIEKLKREYTDKYVVVGRMVPELQRFAGRTGIVRTVNMSGRALVEFLGSNDISWYDIDVDFLKIVDKPAESVEETAPATKEAPSQPTAKKPSKPSTADILAMARGQKPAEATPPKKPSTADILAMARAKKPKQGEPKPTDPATEDNQPE